MHIHSPEGLQSGHFSSLKKLMVAVFPGTALTRASAFSVKDFVDQTGFADIGAAGKSNLDKVRLGQLTCLTKRCFKDYVMIIHACLFLSVCNAAVAAAVFMRSDTDVLQQPPFLPVQRFPAVDFFLPGTVQAVESVLFPERC